MACHKAHIGLDEFELAMRAEFLAFFKDPIRRFLRSTDNVNSWIRDILGECLPTPLVSPTKTAMRPSEQVEAMRSLDSVISESATILSNRSI
jgi:hypothetical protein